MDYSDKDWTVQEDRFDLEKARLQEALFTLGNGYVGSRGILEEGYEESYPGTYFAGVYDRAKGRSFEIVNAPNPLSVQIYVNNRKMSAEQMRIIKHHRYLDLKQGMLCRRTVYEDGSGRYEYESRRFFSMADPHVAGMMFSFKSLDNDKEVRIQCKIDGTTANAMQAVGSAIKHYRVKERFGKNNIIYLEARTGDLNLRIGMASHTTVRPQVGLQTSIDLSQDSIARNITFRARRDRCYHFSRFITFFTSRDKLQDVEKACFREIQRCKKRGMEFLLKRHRTAWEGKWRASDIIIKGDRGSQLALRFNIYHLLSAAPPSGVDASIAAKALSGEWYKGHIFWDTDIYILPFFIYTQPEIARRLLLYRARRLTQARRGAKAQGFKGALWPWESASSGRDETPEEWVNFDGTVIPVYNKKREHHIAGDVIYALALYYRVTGDEMFMLEHGLAMVFETARFWASRTVFNREKGGYEIKNVIGPNEFQECVHNNSYTNYLARWVLHFGVKLNVEFDCKYPDQLRQLKKKLRLSQKEISGWERISENIIFLEDRNGLIEQFEGYYKKRKVIIKRIKKNGMPVWPEQVKLKDVKKTQLVKQADVILLLYLFSGDFSLQEKKINYDYYRKRITHKSSLSISSYAVLASELNRIVQAYKYFTMTSRIDLNDIHGNTYQGIHAASLGGAWQIIVNGFAGVRCTARILSLNPRLPHQWKELKFRISFRGVPLEISVTKKLARVYFLKKSIRTSKKIDVEIAGEKVRINYYSGGIQKRHPAAVIKETICRR